MAMGQAFVSVADDSTAVYWNPAGLGFINKHDIQTMFLSNVFDYKYIYAGYTLPTKYGNVGFSYITAGTTGIPLVASPNAGARPSQGGTFSDRGSSIIISYANDINPKISMGFNIKYFWETLYTASAKGAAIDIGILSEPYKNLKIGVNFVNLLATGFQWAGTQTNPDEHIKRKIKLGMSYTYKDFLVALDSDILKNDNDSVHFGIEYRVGQYLALRGGYNYQNSRKTGDPSFGLGLNFQDFNLDYAFTSISGNAFDEVVHRISFGYKFGEPVGKKNILKKDFETRLLESRKKNKNGT